MNFKKFYHELSIPNEPLVESIDGKRYYSNDGNIKYPSVTTVLGHFKKKSIIEWRNRVGEEEANYITRRAANNGTKLHTICEKYVLNCRLNTEEFSPFIIDAFTKIKPYLDDNLDIVRGVEFPFVSNYLKVGGRIDLIGQYKGINSIIDFKTSLKDKKKEWIEDYFIQCALYSVAYEEYTGMGIPNIVILMAEESKNYGTEFIEKRDKYIKLGMEKIKKYYEDMSKM